MLFLRLGKDLYDLIEGFELAGKHLSKKTLLEFLHFIEGDSESYFKQRDKIYDSIRADRRLVMYQGQFGFFSFNIRVDRNKVIKCAFNIGRTSYDYF